MLFHAKLTHGLHLHRLKELKNGRDEKVLTQVEPPRELRSRFSNPYFVSFGLGQKLTAAKTTQ